MIADGPPKRPEASRLRLNLDVNVLPVLPSQQTVGRVKRVPKTLILAVARLLVLEAENGSNITAV